MAEAVRWQICEGELIQIIGRGRGVNRTSADPLEVTVLTDRPLPLEVAEAVSWDELAPNPEDLMLGQAGVAFEDAADASRAYPNLWLTGEAAKKAFQRARCGTFPIRELYIGKCPAPLRRAKYQRKGPGKRPAVVVFDPKAIASDELRGWLEDRLGELARLDIEEAPPPASQSPAPQNRGTERAPEPASRVWISPDAGEGERPFSTASAGLSAQYARAHKDEAEHAPPWPLTVVEQIKDRRPGSG
jgi:putative DNA primase/helicase